MNLILNCKIVDNGNIYDTNKATFLGVTEFLQYNGWENADWFKSFFYVTKKGIYFSIKLPKKFRFLFLSREYDINRPILIIWDHKQEMIRYLEKYDQKFLLNNFLDDLEEA